MKAVQLNSSDIFAHFHLGYIYRNEGKIPEAIAEYKKVIEQSPNYSWAYFNLGSIAYDQGDYNSALGYLQKP